MSLLYGDAHKTNSDVRKDTSLSGVQIELIPTHVQEWRVNAWKHAVLVACDYMV